MVKIYDNLYLSVSKSYIVTLKLVCFELHKSILSFNRAQFIQEENLLITVFQTIFYGVLFNFLFAAFEVISNEYKAWLGLLSAIAV